jgi:hypothetical protein
MKARVTEPASERHIDTVSESPSNASIIAEPRTGEEVSKLVKTARQDSFAGIESLFYGIAVVAINVNIEHSRKRPQKLQYP